MRRIKIAIQRLRFWLILKLAGKAAVMLNVHIGPHRGYALKMRGDEGEWLACRVKFDGNTFSVSKWDGQI